MAVADHLSELTQVPNNFQYHSHAFWPHLEVKAVTDFFVFVFVFSFFFFLSFFKRTREFGLTDNIVSLIFAIVFFRQLISSGKEHRWSNWTDQGFL